MIYGYVRVSTPEQARPGATSLDDQERRVIGCAMMYSPEAPTIFRDEGVSASIPLAERPQGARLVDALRPGDTLIAAKLDRLFRSALDALASAERFQRDGIALILLDAGAEPVTANGPAKLFFSILAAVAEFERTRIAERISDGRRGKIAQGGHSGGYAPYGWRVVGVGRDARREEVPDEQAVIALIRKMRTDGETLYGISAKLAAIGQLSRTGKPFQTIQIRRILAADAG